MNPAWSDDRCLAVCLVKVKGMQADMEEHRVRMFDLSYPVGHAERAAKMPSFVREFYARSNAQPS